MQPLRHLRGQSPVTYVIWSILLVAASAALVTGRWSVVFVALVTFGLSLVPMALASRLDIRLPRSFIAFIAGFVFATLFLGEVLDFYEQLWWWDIAMHGSSAIGFGLIGFLLVFILFEGDRYAAPAWALGAMGVCVAMTIGTLWEIFEFAMDQTFGLNMQKSGLLDTMGDLIVNSIGAMLGGFAGFLYLKGRAAGGLDGLIEEFIRINRRLFARFRKR